MNVDIKKYEEGSWKAYDFLVKSLDNPNLKIEDKVKLAKYILTIDIKKVYI